MEAKVHMHMTIYIYGCIFTHHCTSIYVLMLYIPCNITAIIGPMDNKNISLIRETTANPMVSNTSIIEMMDNDLTALSHGISRIHNNNYYYHII